MSSREGEEREVGGEGRREGGKEGGGREGGERKGGREREEGRGREGEEREVAGEGRREQERGREVYKCQRKANTTNFKSEDFFTCFDWPAWSSLRHPQSP